MKLKRIVSNIDYKLEAGSLDKEITDIKYDSREIEANNLFIAVSGFKTDGHKYISEAVKKGASAVLIEKELAEYADSVTYIKVDNCRRLMAKLARNFFSNPLADIELIGVTGTNGKTTTAYLLYSILKEYAGDAALFGTIKNVIGEEKADSKRTTAESLDLYRYFSKMKEKGIKYGVMEVSSHALDLYRVEGMEFSGAVFTNLSPEHLDYHKNLDNYRKAKSKLFSGLKKDKFAVINIDDANAEFMAQKSEAKNYFYSLNSADADLYTADYKLKKSGMKYYTRGKINSEFKLNLGGIFNIYNSMAAILTASLLGVDSEIIKKSLNNLKGVPGRFEIINAGQDFQIIVDYAHTPDGMKNVLETAAAMEKERLIVLFGCGGDRDRSKRPAMAKLAEKFADSVIVSSDNPRSEDPEIIFSEIEAGFSKNFRDYIIIEDRKEAIKKAVSISKKNDLLLILGRGHEKYQVLKNSKRKLDDRKVAFKAAEAKNN